MPKSGVREKPITRPAAGRPVAASQRSADAQDEKNRKVHRTITLRKGAMKLQAVEKSQPAKKKKAAKKAPKKKARRR